MLLVSVSGRTQKFEGWGKLHIYVRQLVFVVQNNTERCVFRSCLDSKLNPRKSRKLLMLEAGWSQG